MQGLWEFIDEDDRLRQSLGVPDHVVQMGKFWVRETYDIETRDPSVHVMQGRRHFGSIIEQRCGSIIEGKFYPYELQALTPSDLYAIAYVVRTWTSRPPMMPDGTYVVQAPGGEPIACDCGSVRMQPTQYGWSCAECGFLYGSGWGELRKWLWS